MPGPKGRLEDVQKVLTVKAIGVDNMAGSYRTIGG